MRVKWKSYKPIPTVLCGGSICKGDTAMFFKGRETERRRGWTLHIVLPWAHYAIGLDWGIATKW